MANLQYFQEKIKERRKQTSFRDFLKEIVSWKPIVLHKNSGYISRYPDTERVATIISLREFHEIRNTLTSLAYDFQYNFFENFSLLFQKIPFSSIIQFANNENADYSDASFGGKNIYLSSTIGDNASNIFYSTFCYSHIDHIYNCVFVNRQVDNVYMSIGVLDGCHNVFYSRYILNSNDCWFSSNLIGCHECIFCDNLENMSFCIKNEKYEKDEYFKKKKLLLGQKGNFSNWYTNVSRVGVNYQSKNCTGGALYFSENVEAGYLYSYLKNGRNVMLGYGGKGGSENFYDAFDVGLDAKDFYGVVASGDVSAYHVYDSGECASSSHIFYSYFLENCSYCIGCIGLKNKSYCILNKQYTKEEWEILAEKIFSQMEQDGILGDFFPGKLNPFYFNDTMAGILGDFTKEEVEAEGYMWRDEEIKVDIPAGAEVVYTTPPQSPSAPPSPQPSPLGEREQVQTYSPSIPKDNGDRSIYTTTFEVREKQRGLGGEVLSNYQGYDADGNWYINPEILKKVIQDEKGNYYRIVQMEYDFLVKHGLPLPEIHWMERMKLNFGL